MPDDLELKELEQFIGSQSYVNVFGMKCTEGITYIMSNGYGWFVTDMIVMIIAEYKDEEFLAVKLKLDGDNKAIATIEDGNGMVFYTQKYEYTDAKKDLTLFCCDNVLMLSSEY